MRPNPHHMSEENQRLPAVQIGRRGVVRRLRSVLAVTLSRFNDLLATLIDGLAAHVKNPRRLR